MSLGRQLQHERTRRGWTQAQLAAASGVSAQQIARIEHERVPASEQAMALLLAALKVGAAAPDAAAAAPLPETVVPAVAAAQAVSTAPQPVALHVQAPLRAQLEAAAVAHGRSLHGEILARLEASFAETSQASQAFTSPQSQPPTATAHAPVTWAPQDVDRLTALVAQRLRGAAS